MSSVLLDVSPGLLGAFEAPVPPIVVFPAASPPKEGVPGFVLRLGVAVPGRGAPAPKPPGIPGFGAIPSPTFGVVGLGAVAGLIPLGIPGFFMSLVILSPYYFFYL
uniref:Uncharacterized protein n=1 Tax=Bartonella rochalimae ATCC BAA-1498 TaxID=685782 RepID=E6YL00_9HYPH|nr:hypothetical protein BARRO_30119 [Bartonella rochalimae ATCC BAA-1498]